jgi:hypothetical protein
VYADAIEPRVVELCRTGARLLRIPFNK